VSRASFGAIAGTTFDVRGPLKRAGVRKEGGPGGKGKGDLEMTLKGACLIKKGRAGGGRKWEVEASFTTTKKKNHPVQRTLREVWNFKSGLGVKTSRENK